MLLCYFNNVIISLNIYFIKFSDCIKIHFQYDYQNDSNITIY